MTQAQRNAAILEWLKTFTEQNTTSKTVAREGLIAEGIYTRKGKLRVEYGGKSKKVNSAG